MKKDGMVSVIVEKIKKDKGLDSKPEEGDEYGDDMGLESAAEGIIAAINDESPSDLMQYLKDFVEMCKKDEGD